MTVTINKAICLQAQANDLKCLNPVKNKLEKILGTNFLGIPFSAPKSKVHALAELRKAEGSFVIILAHGGHNYIKGGEYIHRISQETKEADKFLTLEDVDIFRGKIIFCLSCHSNSLALPSIAAGAQAFVGFEEIPFNRFDEEGNQITNHDFEQHIQRLISDGTKTTLERFVTGQSTLEEAVDFFRLWICQKAVNFVRDSKSIKQRREIAALLLKTKNGIQYYGRSNIRFVK